MAQKRVLDSLTSETVLTIALNSIMRTSDCTEGKSGWDKKGDGIDIDGNARNICKIIEILNAFDHPRQKATFWAVRQKNIAECTKQQNL